MDFEPVGQDAEAEQEYRQPEQEQPRHHTGREPHFTGLGSDETVCR